MGLLMYGYKEAEEERKRKDTIKSDPTAASRSAIRRQPTIRRRNNPPTERRDGRASPRALRLSLENYVVDDRDGEIVIAPRPRLRQSESSSTYWDNENSRRTYRAQVEEHLRLQAAQNMEPARARPESRPFPPPRESFLRNEIRHDDEIDEIDRAIYERAAAIANPSTTEMPPYLRDYHPTLARSRDVRGNSPPPQRSSRFAPAFRFERNEPESQQPTWARRADRRSRSPRQQQHVDESSRTSSPIVSDNNFPPLERTMARRYPVEHRVSTPRHDVSAADGLGDRRRSPSPSEDAWETLITTIAHDEHLPSNESSFTSATAPISRSSFTDSQPATSATTPSLAGALNQSGSLHRDRDCDDADDGMQTPDSLPDLVAVERGDAMTVRPELISRRSNGPAEDQLDSSLVQSLAEARRELQRDIDTYSRMQRILDSYHRRGETVPEEMWQAFGLRNALAGAADGPEDLGVSL